MRLSEFWLAVEHEFGVDYGRVLTRDVVLEQIGGRTADEGIKAGVPARDIWLALCEVQDVPVQRRHGVGRRDPRK